MMRTKLLNKTASNVIREILLEKWDPLNVGDNPALADEYDSFVPNIYNLLVERASDEEALCGLLAGFEKTLGISVPDGQRHDAAQALLHLRLDLA